MYRNARTVNLILLILFLTFGMSSGITLPRSNIISTRTTDFVESYTQQNIKKGTTEITNSGSTSTQATNTTNCWTFLIYMGADNDLEKFAVKDIKEMIRATSKGNGCVRIIVQIDRHTSSNSTAGYSNAALPGEAAENTGTVRYEIKNGVLTKLQDLGEKNTGSASTLKNFINWGAKTYPASKMALIIWNHGMGSNGAVVDETSASDQLTLKELKNGIKSGLNGTGRSKFDVIGFDACYMGQADVITELYGLADYMVGALTTEPGDGWNYYKLLCEVITKSGMSPRTLANTIVDTYGNHYKNKPANQLNAITAVDMNYVPRLVKSMKEFSNYTKSLIESSNNTQSLQTIRDLIWAYWNGTPSDSDQQTDLYQFLGIIQQYTKDIKLRQLAQAIRDIVLYMRTSRWMGNKTSLLGTAGIGIDTFKSSNRTQLMNQTGWYKIFKCLLVKWQNATIQNYVKTNNVTITSPIDVIKSLFPTPTENTPTPAETLDELRLNITERIPEPFYNMTWNFNAFNTTFDTYPISGKIVIKENGFGDRIDGTIVYSDYVQFTSPALTGTFPWYPVESGWRYLEVYFLPDDSNLFSVFDQFRFTSPNYFVPHQESTLTFESDYTTTNFGQAKNISITITNTGSTNFGGGSVNFDIVNIATSNNTTETSTIPNLNPGESVNISIIYNPDAPGFHVIEPLPGSGFPIDTQFSFSDAQNNPFPRPLEFEIRDLSPLVYFLNNPCQPTFREYCQLEGQTPTLVVEFPTNDAALLPTDRYNVTFQSYYKIGTFVSTIYTYEYQFYVNQTILNPNTNRLQYIHNATGFDYNFGWFDIYNMNVSILNVGTNLLPLYQQQFIAGTKSSSSPDTEIRLSDLRVYPQPAGNWSIEFDIFNAGTVDSQPGQIYFSIWNLNDFFNTIFGSYDWEAVKDTIDPTAPIIPAGETITISKSFNPCSAITETGCTGVFPGSITRGAFGFDGGVSYDTSFTYLNSKREGIEHWDTDILRPTIRNVSIVPDPLGPGSIFSFRIGEDNPSSFYVAVDQQPCASGIFTVDPTTGLNGIDIIGGGTSGVVPLNTLPLIQPGSGSIFCDGFEVGDVGLWDSIPSLDVVDHQYGWDLNFTVNGLTQGTLTIFIDDNAGNVSNFTVNISNSDNQPPIIELTSLTNGDTINAGDTIDLTITDNVRITDVKVEIDGVNSTLTSPYKIVAPSTPGTFEFTIYASDGINTATKMFTFTIKDTTTTTTNETTSTSTTSTTTSSTTSSPTSTTNSDTTLSENGNTTDTSEEDTPFPFITIMLTFVVVMIYRRRKKIIKY